MTSVNLNVNGLPVTGEVEDRTTLADFVRNQQNLTGTHLGCEHGVCGACTVLVDGVPMRSCIAYVPALQGRDVRTIEGFGDSPVMQALRKAFNEEHALQCGYCTPGMLVTAHDVVTRFAEADEARIRTELAGNICRCTGYQGIVTAIQRVMRELPPPQRLKGTGATPPVPPAFGPLRRFSPAAIAAALPKSPGVEISALADGWSRISDSFVVAKSAEQVWAAFADVASVARCLPGASISEVAGNQVKGMLRVGFGPIKAEFACSGTVERDDSQKRGTMRGAGGDARRGTQAQGKVSYHVTPEGGHGSRVAVTIDYQLQGPLAQFSRSGLVRDFARMMIADFAAELSASLGGAAGAARPPARLNVAALLLQALKARLGALFRRRARR